MGYCSFCLEGWDRSPYAEAEFDALIAKAKELKRNSGASDLDILSFNFNTHSRIFDLLLELNKIFRRVSFMSQRLDILAGTEGLMEAELAGGKRSFTLGIEGISKGLRSYYRKGLDEEDLGKCLDFCLRRGVRELKLFFIISGRESPEDLEEFDSLMKGIEGRKAASGSGTNVLVSAGFLVRLPFTPLQYEAPSFDAGRLVGIADRMRDSCTATGAEFRLAGSPEECFADQTLSLFGGSLMPYLLRIPSLGFVYDGSLSRKAWESLERYISALPDLPMLLGAKTRDFRPPLAFIVNEDRHAALWSHYEAAIGFKDRASCFGGRCSACGACVDGKEREGMTGHRIASPRQRSGYLRDLAAVILEKGRFASISIEAAIPEELAFAEPAYRVSWLSRRIFAAYEAASFMVFEIKESIFVPGSVFGTTIPHGTGRFGISRFSVFGPSRERLAALLSRLGAQIPGLKVLEAPAPLEVDLGIRLQGINLESLGKVLGSWLEANRVAFTIGASRASREAKEWN
ncbi:MAG: Radical SAM domain-containing protein [Spirochaetes bacterium]|nr:MAG: Radical SAM domain-containing protein [Spirochaetota bacterium]